MIVLGRIPVRPVVVMQGESTALGMSLSNIAGFVELHAMGSFAKQDNLIAKHSQCSSTPAYRQGKRRIAPR
jgi:hypothetical protein